MAERNKKIVTHYSVLGLHRGQHGAAVREAYVAKAKRTHPDKGEARAVTSNVFVMQSDAYRVLRDPAQRSVYDLQLDLNHAKCGGCRGKGYLEHAVGFKGVEERLCLACDGAGVVYREGMKEEK